MRTCVYIDGFNLYRGALKDSPYRWLDLKALMIHTLPKDADVVKIKYFTAAVHNTEDNPSIANRQDVYLRALAKYIPEIEIHKGRFKAKKKYLPLVEPLENGDSSAYVRTFEEKRTDVNIAIHLVNDAWKDSYDWAFVVSTDSDLCGAVQMVVEEREKAVGLVIPTNRAKPKELAQHAFTVRHITHKSLAESQLPNPIPDSRIHKPALWEVDKEEPMSRDRHS